MQRPVTVLAVSKDVLGRRKDRASFCLVGSQRLEFFDGDFAHEMGSPYFYPHKNVGS